MKLSWCVGSTHRITTTTVQVQPVPLTETPVLQRKTSKGTPTRKKLLTTTD